MYPVTQDFLDKMKADRRQVLARVAIDYTDPFIDQSIRIEASEQANVSYPQQTADSVDQTTRKYACLDGTWDLTSGEYHLAPSADQLAQRQFGWWGAQFCDQDGYFASPYPTLTVRHSPRPMRQLKVVGDTARGEYPVDFTVKLYGSDDTLLKTETVTGNDQVSWQKALEPQVPDVAKQVLEITKWSLPGTCVKIIEFFTSIREVYETGDLVSLRLLEEREASQGSLPVGNISSNEITLALNNESKKFDVDNDQSPLKNLLKPNRRIQAWLGLKGGGEGMNIQRNVDFSQGELNNLVVVNNKLQLPDVGSPSFSRNSVAYLSDGTQVAANQPRFEQGKFGQAVMVEEGTENLVPSLVAFTLRDHDSRSLTVIDDNMVISTCIAEGDTAFAATSPKVNVTEGEIYTFSFYAKANGLDGLDGRPSATNWRTKINWYDGNDTLIAWSMLTDTTLYEDWKRYIITAQAPTGAVKAEVIIGGDTPNFSYVGAKAYFKNIQLEQKTYATTFIDGTRAAETLAIPAAGVLNPQEGTIEFWWCPINQPASTMTSSQLVAPPIIQVGNYNHNNSWVLWCGINGQLKLLVRGDNVTGWTGQWTIIPDLSWYQLNRWYHIVVRWENANTFWVFIDGVKYGPYVSSQPFTGIAGNIMSLGKLNAASGPSNALFDDTRISNRARTDEEILAAYQSGQPLPVDEWTTYKLSLDGNLNFGQGGYYISPEYDLSAVGTAATSAITWQEDADGVQRTVYAKLDSQSDWTQVQNGGKLPISTGSVLTGRKLQIKTKLIKV